MANPSLQIGNDNWAIKEDNLLGYSTAGTRFVPQPITMTRASAGTRVNPQGLVETVELLGSEQVVNGDFATDSSWIKGTGWSIAGGNATLAVQAASSSLSSNSMSVTVGKLYRITINVSATSSGFRLYDSLGVVSYGLPLGESVFYRTPSSSIYTVTPLGLAGASGIVTSVSVKEYQANDLARVDYTGSTSSLLAEPQRTNLITYSSDFSQWSNSGFETSNYSVSPDGTQNASRYLFTGSGQSSQIVTSVSSGVEVSGSLYIKGVAGETIQIASGGADELFTLTSDWKRYDSTKTTLNSSFNVNTYGGATARDIQVWGAQLEEGSYATSYIPTSGSTVTRVQDQYSKTGISDKINSEEGVLFVEMAALANDGTYRYVLLSDGATANTVQIRYSNVSNNIQALVYNSSALQAFTSYTPTDTTSFHKIAFKYKENDFALWVDGTEVGTDTSGIPPINLSSLNFQTYLGKVKQLQVFKTALTDSELATLTTI